MKMEIATHTIVLDEASPDYVKQYLKGDLKTVEISIGFDLELPL